MGIRPKDFWSMSFKEWILALEGFVDFNTVSPTDDKPLTKADPEWKELMKDDPNGRK
ncbi:MAG: hypothetical protein KAJ19_27665 [Gammaproteobacteria bacterium]|nr:hypothetical protein [Gammaproteobacteria bacterium]